MTLFTHHGSEESLPNDLRYLLQTQDGTDSLRFVFYREVDSTNTRALELARRGYPHGTVVIADCQHQGRGRRTRRWFSPEGKNIYMTLIFRQAKEVLYPELITLYAAVCVIEAVERNVEGSKGHLWTKWPNDIYWEEGKLGGILTEGLFSSKQGIFVIGIGLNVNSTKEELAANTDGRGTSLLIETGRPFRRDRIIRDIASLILNNTGLLMDAERLRKQWTALSRTPGAQVVVKGEKESYRAVAMGINERGHLVVRHETDGRLRTLCAEEVVHLR